MKFYWPSLFTVLCASAPSLSQGEGLRTRELQSQDPFGVTMLYPSDPAKSGSDWFNNWSGSTRTLDRAGEADPQDGQTVMKGRGEITIGSDKCIFHPEVPRLFVNSNSGQGFENIEFTTYARWEKGGNEKSYSGFTMIGRTNHFFYKDDGCNAAGYYMRIWKQGTKEGQAMFQKEYYHGTKPSYSSGVYTPVFGSFPENQWIGLKFVIFTVPGTSNVQLELYIDETDGQSGGNWQLVHQYVDEPGKWYSKDNDVPSSCPIGDGDTVLGARQSCALRTDGGEVHWKKASVRHISVGTGGPTPTPPGPTPTPPGPMPPVPSPSPPPPPTDGWTTITFDDFENGWGNYASGGRDAMLYTEGAFAHQGSNAIEIQDDLDDSRFYHQQEHDVSGYDTVRVNFWFVADDMESDEGFKLEYTANGGSHWTTAASWYTGSDFAENQFYNKQVMIDARNMNTMKIGFICDGSSNSDSVFIDQIRFEGA